MGDVQGNSRISFADQAIPLVDELEIAQHRRGRFTIGITRMTNPRDGLAVPGLDQLLPFL
jgi:hypothetical protein